MWDLLYFYTMKKIELDPDKFLKQTVTMLLALDKLEVNTMTLFLVELVRESEGGFVVIQEKRQLIMDRMRISEANFNKMVLRLGYEDHLLKDGGVIRLHPKYRAVKECEGCLVIMEKEKKKGV